MLPKGGPPSLSNTPMIRRLGLGRNPFMPEHLKDEANYFQSVVLASPDYIRIIGLDGRIEFVNPTGLRMLDTSEGRVLGAYWPDLWTDPREKKLLEDALAAARAGETRSFRACLIRPNFEPRWLDTTVSPVFAADGQTVIRILGVSRNVTAEVGSRALLDSILECVPAPLFAKELNTGRFVFLNQVAADLFGHSIEDMVGQTPAAFFKPEQVLPMLRSDQVAADTDGIHATDSPIVTPLNGRVRIRRIRKKATPGPGERYVVCLSEDITEEREREDALKQALEEAEAANRAKSQFLAVMGHEIRSPLNGVLGMAQAMELGELPPEQRRRLKVIREAGQVLLGLLNDMLDLSRISAGGLSLEDGLIDGRELAEAAHNLFDGLAAEKDLSFELQLGADAAGPWRGDPARVRQIITNLIGNAVKFTDRGRVGLRIAVEGDSLLLAVSDSGPGIPHAMLERIFEPFAQLDPSNTRRHGGSGLGLAICRNLAQMMGGEIMVASVLGQGSTFTLRLPLERIERPPETARNAAPDLPRGSTRPLKILAAEDNPMNQLVLSTLMDAMDLSPQIVSNGEEAVAAWRREPWDLILMDVQMPVMDGLEATRLIRAAEQAENLARTPIIALTANAMQHQIEEYTACGLDSVVAKPLEIRALLAAIHALTGPAAETAAAGPLETAAS